MEEMNNTFWCIHIPSVQFHGGRPHSNSDLMWLYVEHVWKLRFIRHTEKIDLIGMHSAEQFHPRTTITNLNKLVERDSCEAMDVLGRWYLGGGNDTLPLGEKRGIELLHKAARAGNNGAKRQWKDFSRYCCSKRRSWQGNEALFYIAAKLGYPEALFLLGLILIRGLRDPQNPVRMRWWSAQGMVMMTTIDVFL